MNDAMINELVEPILRERLGRFGFDHSEVHSGQDADGDPMIFITAHYRPGQEGVETSAALSAIRALREALARRNEFRFPHLRHHYPDDETEPDLDIAVGSTG